MEHNNTPDNERRIGELEGGKGWGKKGIGTSCLGEEWLDFCHTTFKELIETNGGASFPQDARSPTA